METLGRMSICRLCALEKDSYLRIYDEEGYKLALGIKINKYLHIQIDEKDSLPKGICCECYTKLEEYSNFVNNSQNAQIALLKIFPIYDDSSLKEENLYSHETIFHAQSNLLNFNTNEMDKVDQRETTFECNELNLTTPSNGCFFDNDKPPDCLYEERNKILRNTAPAENCTGDLDPPQCNELNNEDCNNMNSTDCNLFNLRKKFNKRKCITPVRYFTNNVATARTKRKLNRKKKLGASKKKKVDSGTKQDQEDYSENESELFREKYFGHIPWMCTGCEANFQTLSELQDHHANYHLQSSRYMCPYCYKVYMQYQGFVSHMKKHQCDTEATCDQCGKVFSSKRMLESHLLLHTDKRPYQCNHCGKSFRQQSALYVHNRCHLPEHMKVEYSCDQCDKNFSTKPNLITHKKIHTGVRNHVCDLCGKSFVQKGNLCAHKLTHSNNKPFTCEICNKEFKTLMQLRKHSNVHTGKKPHQCDTCGRTFRERGTLKEHYRIHTGAMPFSCEFCGKAFRFKGVLTTHRRQHTGEKPYSCVECQHHFTNWPNYNKHMKRRHGINTSKATRIKSDNPPQNAPLAQDAISNNSDNIDIPSFEDTLQPVSADGDKAVDLFDTTNAADSHMATTYLLSHQNYGDTSQHQNSILNAYYNMTALQAINQTNEAVDMMNTNMYRDYV